MLRQTRSMAELFSPTVAALVGQVLQFLYARFSFEHLHFAACRTSVEIWTLTASKLSWKAITQQVQWKLVGAISIFGEVFSLLTPAH